MDISRFVKNKIRKTETQARSKMFRRIAELEFEFDRIKRLPDVDYGIRVDMEERILMLRMEADLYAKRVVEAELNNIILAHEIVCNVSGYQFEPVMDVDNAEDNAGDDAEQDAGESEDKMPEEAFLGFLSGLSEEELMEFFACIFGSMSTKVAKYFLSANDGIKKHFSKEMEKAGISVVFPGNSKDQDEGAKGKNQEIDC